MIGPLFIKIQHLLVTITNIFFDLIKILFIYHAAKQTKELTYHVGIMNEK